MNGSDDVVDAMQADGGRSTTDSIRVRSCGAAVAEFVVVIPTLLMMIMAVLQAAFAFHAKSQVNHATAAAARAGSFENAAMNAMTAAFTRGMAGYYGGGTSLGELTASLGRATADFAGNVRIRSAVADHREFRFAVPHLSVLVLAVILLASLVTQHLTRPSVVAATSVVLVASLITATYAISRWPGGNDGPGIAWSYFVGGLSVLNVASGVALGILIYRKSRVE